MKKKRKFQSKKRPQKKHKEEIKSRPHNIYISEFDRITYIYSTNLAGKHTKVVNVSYEISIKGQWQLVSRYDSEHGYLHCHMTISMHDKAEIVLPTTKIIKKGNPKDWLSWAIKDIKSHFFEYRKGFLKRSGIKEIY